VVVLQIHRPNDGNSSCLGADAAAHALGCVAARDLLARVFRRRWTITFRSSERARLDELRSRAAATGGAVAFLGKPDRATPGASGAPPA